MVERGVLRFREGNFQDFHDLVVEDVVHVVLTDQVEQYLKEIRILRDKFFRI